ncbi:amidase [Ligilactobacillus sp. LYQ135]
MDDLQLMKLPAYQLAAMVRKKEISSEELVQISVANIEKQNSKLNAVVHLRKAKALQEARNLKDNGQPFLGVPLLIKGLGQSLKGESDTNASQLFAGQIAKQTSNFVKKAQAAGFIIIGQTNCPEFGFKNITDSKLYGDALNPWNLKYNAGGSSGGSAAAVAAGMVPIALGNDGGGSIRIPAAWNGCIGLKPTRGRIIAGPTNWRSWQGASVNFAITRNLKDTAMLLDLFQTVQTAAVFQWPLFETSFCSQLKKPSTKIKIGYTVASPVNTPVSIAAKRAVYQVVDFLHQQGFEVNEISLPMDDQKLIQSYYLMNAAETAAMFMPIESKVKKSTIETLSWALYQTGKNIKAFDYSLALQTWDEAAAHMAHLHQEYPLILTPTNAFAAPLNTQQLVSKENLEKMEQITRFNSKEQQQIIYDQWLPSLQLTPFTQLANLTGEPAISLPTYVNKQKLPLGIQFQAAKGREDLLLQMGYLFEKNQQFQML